MEKIILANLINNDEYSRKVLTFLKPEYFYDNNDRIVFKLIDDFCKKYNELPSKEALSIDLSNLNDISEDQFKQTKEIIDNLNVDDNTKIDWLIDRTEEFCQSKAIYNAIRQSIKILDDKEVVTKNSIPKLLQDALQVSFDTHIGHDFIEDYDERFDSYHKKENRVDFDITYLNKITNGGLPDKTLNVILAGTGVGKSLAMCHMAAHNLMCNKSVLYITLEMAEERIAQRIDTNLLNISLDDLLLLPKDLYTKKIDKVKETTKGKLIIKEYPTATAGSNHFRHLLNELRIKKNFVPDIVYIDYLNLCISARLKFGANVNSYSYIKAIAEELRGLAVEFEFPIVTATQANRAAMIASDLGLENTSDSIGLPMTADFMVAMISTEELQDLNQIVFKQLKNRYGDPSVNRKFVVGVDRSKMRLYDVEQNAQDDLLDGPIMDKTTFGERDNDEYVVKKKFDKSKFEGFK